MCCAGWFNLGKHSLLIMRSHSFSGELRMSHIAKSKILEEIILELRGKGLQIPANVLTDLKSARTLMKVEKADARGGGETEPKIDQYLGNVEAYVITEAGNQFPTEKVEKWLKELDLASCDSCITIVKEKEEMRMIAGIPRDQKWIRVEPIESLPLEKLEQMATDTKLGFRREKDGRLIVYGSPDCIKSYLRKMTETANGNGKQEI